MITSVQAEIVYHRIKIMQAFLDNTEIQHQFKTGDAYGLWYDGTGPKSPIPNFELYNYRIKPEVKTYRVGLMDSDIRDKFTVVVGTKTVATELESNPDFIKWLTDWIEYEV